jgi:transcriptional regulator with XRE-family HTH domain
LTPQLGALGDALAEFRDRAGLSQEALAHACDTKATHISKLERGQRNPTYETLYRIATALGTTVGELTAHADKLLASEKRRSA